MYAKQLGLQRVYVLDDGTMRDLALYFRRSARAIGLGLAGSAQWDPIGRGFAALAERMQRARADGVFFSGTVGASNGGSLVRELRGRLGPDVKFFAGNPFGPVSFLWDSSGGAAKGMYITSPGLPYDNLGARGRRFLADFRATSQPGVPIRSEAVYAAAATEVPLGAIARSDGTRASVTRALLATRTSDGIIGPVSFDRNGDMRAPVTIMRVDARDGVSDVPTYEGAAIVRVITPPPDAIR